jgi:hypothetical protein
MEKKMRTAFVVLAATVHSSLVQSQEARPIAAEPPIIEFQHGFTSVTQVAELSAGRVVVLDRADATAWLADPDSRVASKVGREGAGPSEYRRPMWLLPLGGDSVGVYDDAAIRVMIIGPDGRPGGFIPVFAVEPGGERIPALQADGRGGFYGTASPPPASQRMTQGDSVALYRWKPGEPRAVRIGAVHQPLPTGAMAVAPGSRVLRPGSSAQPSTRNMWTAGPDGRIAVVHHTPYHVIFLSPTGGTRVGHPISFDRMPLTDAIKRAYVSEFGGSQTVMIVDASGKARTERTRPPALNPESINWLDEVPPFRGNAFVAFAPGGTLWIQRSTFGREGAKYDLVNRDGAVIDRVRLPEGHRVVGFGRDVLYVVRRDADDVEYLQLRPLPR